jgi:hypothetical protein
LIPNQSSTKGRSSLATAKAGGTWIVVNPFPRSAAVASVPLLCLTAVAVDMIDPPTLAVIDGGYFVDCASQPARSGSSELIVSQFGDDPS